MTIKSVVLGDVTKGGMPVTPTIDVAAIRKANIPFDINDEDSLLEASCLFAERYLSCNVDYSYIIETIDE